MGARGQVYTIKHPYAEASTARLGESPDPAQLPPMPAFGSAHASSHPGVPELLAAMATSPHTTSGDATTPNSMPVALTKPGPYNSAAALPPKIFKKILELEFVEMAELKRDI